MITYPQTLSLKPIFNPPTRYTISVPGSKSITNRALVLAALSSRHTPCTLTGVLQSEDTEVMVDGLKQLGFELEADWVTCTVTVKQNNTGRLIPKDTASIYCANSGTTIRFLAAMLALGHGKYTLDGVARMRERPIQDLLDALNDITGVKAVSNTGTGCAPITITSQGNISGRVTVKADVSSQFLSALIMMGAFSETGFAIDVSGEMVSEPYVDMTVAMVKAWGGHVVKPQPNSFVLSPATTGVNNYPIEPDASSASYFFALGAVLGTPVLVQNVRKNMLQGDIAFVDALSLMGADVVENKDGITVTRTGDLHGIEIDMNAISDTVMTLAAVACFAKGKTKITNVPHIRHKETDRIAAVAKELRKVGIAVTEFEDGLEIVPGPMHGATLSTYNDHRMAMSLAILGLKVPGIVIDNPGCVAKTFPDFWQRWPGA